MVNASINTRLLRSDPRRLKLLDQNARFMRHEVFSRLVSNVQADGSLTSIPFCWRLHDDTTQTPILDADGNPIYEVLSGNHRVKAAVAAGLTDIDVLVTDQYLPPDRRRAIQLSHNAITGEDDPATLKTVFDSITDVDYRLYSGLDDKQLALFASVSVEGLSEANLKYQTISLVFLPAEVTQVAAVWDTVKAEIKGSAGTWLASFAQYDQCMDALEAAGAAHGIRNTATALMVVLEIFSRHITDLREAFLDDEGEPVEGGRQVPIETLLGSLFLPAKVGARLNRITEKLIGAGELDAQKRWQVLEKLIEAYEHGQQA